MRPNPLGDSSRRLNTDDSSCSPNHGHILNAFSTDQLDKEMLCEWFFQFFSSLLLQVCLLCSFLSLSLFHLIFLSPVLQFFFFYPSNTDDVAHNVHEPWSRSENNYFATCEKSMRISITACDQELTVPIQVNYLLYCAQCVQYMLSGQCFSSLTNDLCLFHVLSVNRKNLLEIYE